MSHHEVRTDSLDVDAKRGNVEQLLAEMEQLFAEVVAGAQSQTDLTDEQLQQSQRVIRDTMESARRMVERFAAARPPRNEQH